MEKTPQTKYLNLNACSLYSPMDFVSSQEETPGPATREELETAAHFCLTLCLPPTGPPPSHIMDAHCSWDAPFPWLGRYQTEFKERNVTVILPFSVTMKDTLLCRPGNSECPPLAASVSGTCISSPRWGSKHREWLRGLRSRVCDIVLDMSLPFFALGLVCWWPVKLPASSHVFQDPSVLV